MDPALHPPAPADPGGLLSSATGPGPEQHEQRSVNTVICPPSQTCPGNWLLRKRHSCASVNDWKLDSTLSHYGIGHLIEMLSTPFKPSHGRIKVLLLLYANKYVGAIPAQPVLDCDPCGFSDDALCWLEPYYRVTLCYCARAPFVWTHLIWKHYFTQSWCWSKCSLSLILVCICDKHMCGSYRFTIKGVQMRCDILLNCFIHRCTGQCAQNKSTMTSVS